MSEYALWLTDDSGHRLTLLAGFSDPFFFSYTRVISGLGTMNFGLSFREFDKKVKPYFRPDLRVEIWRSPSFGVPLRREDVYMLRKPNIYTRDDGVQAIQFYGRNGIDLLKRRSVIQRAGTAATDKTDQVDDLMKAIVRQQMLYGSALDEDSVVDNTRAWPQNEFSVQGDLALGPSVSRAVADRNVFDVLKELKEASFQLHTTSASNRRIYFDVLPKDLTGITTKTNSPLGWEFQTFADLRGADRTGGIEFSLENENIEKPAYSISHLDEVSSVIVRGNGRANNQLTEVVDDATRVNSSRWNRVEKVISASSESSTSALQDAARAELYKSKPVEEIFATFLNSPGGPNAPRSLYGIDWDLGDLVRVNYAGKQFEAEIGTVYVAVEGVEKETITGRNNIQA